MSLPSINTWPPQGRCRPSMVLSSTDLPLPEPPTIPSTSPGITSRLTPSCTTCWPKRLTSLRTEMTGVCSLRAFMAGRLEVELHEHDGKDGVGENHQEDGLHHRHGRQPTQLTRGIPHLHAAIGADQGDQYCEHRRLDQPCPESRRRQRVLHSRD